VSANVSCAFVLTYCDNDMHLWPAMVAVNGKLGGGEYSWPKDQTRYQPKTTVETPTYYKNRYTYN